MRLYITILLALFTFMLFGQNSQVFFKFVPNTNSEMPDWARLMYSDDVNVWEVDQLFAEYYKVNEFEKSIHTQNYKFWRKAVNEYCQDDGQIRVPSIKDQRERTERIKERKQATAQRSSTDIWSSIGPFKTYRNNTTELFSQHANVYSIDVSSTDQDHILIGTESGGVFNTFDKGLNWSLITADEDLAGGITAVQIDPDDEDRYLVYANQSIYESINQGATWTILYTVGDRVDEISFDPDDSDNIYLSAQNGLHRSDDGGSTWTHMFNDAIWDVDFHPTDTDVVYLLKSNPSLIRSELFKSIDNGVTFSIEDTGWYVPEVASEANDAGGKIAVSADDPDRVYAALIGNSKTGDNGWIGLYRSNDSGDTWSLPSGQIGGPYQDMNVMPWSVASYGSGYHQGFYNFDFEASQDDADLMWLGTIRLAESSDGGTTYTSIGAANSTRLDYIHADIQALEIENGDIWVVSDGGLNLSTDNLNTHEARHNGIIASNFWGFGTGWNEDVYVGGKYHNGNTTFRGNYGEGNTHNVGGVEEATGYVNPLLNNNAYFNQYWSGHSVRKILSDELGGNTVNGTPVNMIPNESYVQSSSSGLYFDPYYADKMYAGESNTIQTSEDGGSTWETLYTFPVEGNVYEIEIARSDPGVLYCVFHPGGYWDWSEIYKSIDGGQSFTKLSDIPANRWRLEFSIDPYNPETIWVTAVNGGNGEKVFSSTDSGITWVNETTAILDDQSTNDILYQPGSGGVAYLVTTNGFYYYDPATSDWVDYSSGLPFQVKALTIKPFYAQNTIRIATYGRGVWEAEIPVDYTESAAIITSTDTIRCSRDTVYLDSYSILDQTDASWSWTIDPAPSYISDATSRNPKVVLGTNGSYTATLEVTAGGNTISHTETDYITVDSQCDPDTIPGLAVQTMSDGDWVQLPTMDVNATNTFTMSAWVKPNGIQPAYAGIVMGDDESTGLNFREDNNTLGYHWPGGAWWYDSNLTVPSNEWSHVAMVVDANGVTLYLNGTGVTHSTTPSAVDINTMKIGSYKGWGGRNFSGEIDEVAIWNRALTQDEIRSHRHLTKEDLPDDDPDFLAYYQFNSGGTEILDRIGIRHGNIAGNATTITSTVAVGGGDSEKANLSAAGNYTFVDGNISIELGDQGSMPNGDVWVSLLNVDPYNSPDNIEGVGSYFIINNYGDTSFTTDISYTYNDPLSSPLSSSTESPQTITLVERIANADDVNWDIACDQATVDGEVYTFEGCIEGFDKQYRLYKECLDSAIETENYPAGTAKALFVNTTIEATNRISNGADIYYKAGDHILLDNGFTTETGGILLIEIGDCEN